jgi:hypothetical protein
VREDQAAKYGFDVKAILAAPKKRQRRSGHKIVLVARGPGKKTSRNQVTVR